MTNPYRTLLTEMAADLDWRQQLLMDNCKATHPLADRARVLLDQQQPESAADCLAARPLMEKVAAMGDCIGRHTVSEIIAISDQAAAWLTANPPRASSCVEFQPPADGEIARLQRRLKRLAHAATMENWREFDMRVPAEPLRDADLVLTRAADLLQHQHPQPVAVSERPWEREGWCDAEGRCWIFRPDIGTDPSWRLTDPRDVGPYHTHSLPAHALPTPEATNG